MNIKIILLSLLSTFAFAANMDMYEISRGKINTPFSEQSFDETLALYEFVVVDFYAEWCNPCKQMHKTFDALAQDSSLDSVLFVKINVDHHPKLSQRYHVYGLPTIAFFVDGKIINSVAGLRNKAELKRLISQTFFKQ